MTVPEVIDDDFYPDGRPILDGPSCRYCHGQNLACLERAERDDGFELAAYSCRSCKRRTTYCTTKGDA